MIRRAWFWSGVLAFGASLLALLVDPLFAAVAAVASLVSLGLQYRDSREIWIDVTPEDWTETSAGALEYSISRRKAQGRTAVACYMRDPVGDLEEVFADVSVRGRQIVVGVSSRTALVLALHL